MYFTNISDKVLSCEICSKPHQIDILCLFPCREKNDPFSLNCCKIKKIREHYGIPQGVFADYPGITRSQLYIAENRCSLFVAGSFSGKKKWMQLLKNHCGKIAVIKDCPVDEVAEITTRNALGVFGEWGVGWRFNDYFGRFCRGRIFVDLRR